MTRLLLSFVLIAGSIATMHAEADADAEIRALIQAVAESDCEFNRNGSLHSAEMAAAHLELKYARGKRYADSAAISAEWSELLRLNSQSLSATA